MPDKMLDKIDIDLIKELQKDGRQTYADLAKKLGVPESTIRRRLKSLLAGDFIRIIAVPNPINLGFSLVCSMRVQVRKENVREIGMSLAQYPNVRYLTFTTGEWDILAIVVFRSAQELADFMWEKVVAVPEVVRTDTAVNIEIVKSSWKGSDNVAELIEVTGL